MSTWVAGWYPDPLARHEHRYWDGREWTHHVGSAGQQSIDPVYAAPPSTSNAHPDQPSAPAGTHDGHEESPPRRTYPESAPRSNKKIQKQVRKLRLTDGAAAGDDSWLDEPVLVVNQKGKLLEVNAEYVVHDRSGRQVGSIREVGQSLAKKAMSHNNRTRRFVVLDQAGHELVSLTRPTVWLKAKMVVRGPSGREVGQIARAISFDYSRFKLEADGRTIGVIRGENGRQSDFSIQDASGAEVGRITRTFAGVLKEVFTKADSYVVEIHRPLEEPLRTLVMAAALAVDTALRQR